MTRGQERCVVVFSARTFEELHERIRTAPMTSKRTRDYMRLFLSGASAEQPDKQNRVTIPQNLREYAGLERDLTVIGSGDRAEIWSTTAWEAYYAEAEEAFADNDEEVIPGIF
ncbi:cell division/cell wall cluster transcriptional repressor MraZ [Sphingomonas sp. LR61]|jgi:MraZ protein